MTSEENEMIREYDTYYSIWFPNLRNTSTAKVRLYCLPHAGGGASSFQGWSRNFGNEIDVCPIQLPGRENRIAERPYDRMLSLVQVLGKLLSTHIDRPYAFFGHSMGALISFELARYLSFSHGVRPACLFLSAHTAPDIRHREPPKHTLSREQFLEAIHQFGGTPEKVLFNEELLEIVLPTLRSDLAICETYEYKPGEKLSCPIRVFGGADDKSVDSADLEAWRQQTTGSFNLEMHPGNHFFLNDARTSLFQSIYRELKQACDL